MNLSRRALLAATTLLPMLTNVSAQEVLDGSDSGIEPTTLQQLFTAANASLLDGYSAKYSNLHQAERAVCGKVNGKNAFGAYVGETRFMFTPEDNHFSLLSPAGSPMHRLQVMAFRYGPCPTY